MSEPGQSPALTEYKTEFRSYPDDAWYSVRLVGDGEGEKLTVKYYNFSDHHDNVFEAKTFKSLQDLADFMRRFRNLSAQVQDSECSKVVEGKLVCASHSFDDNDNRFYDAIIEAVKYNEHSFTNGEEECRCKFLICWQHGPNRGNLEQKNVENICIVDCSENVDPALSSFLKRATEEIQAASRRISNLTDRIKQDEDVGGVNRHYIVLIDNLEKELSSSTIVEFVRREISIASEACVFPSLSTESYTRGAILLKSEKDSQLLYGFLDNPNHIIVSSNGKPWVIMEKISGPETIRTSLCTSLLKSQVSFSYLNTDELKVVHSGSEEFRTAKGLKDLFMEFAEHQKLLHVRLVTEERKILQS
ncbi:hypothetical protein CFOL_v3_11959, partial [Cephalotus follicularis]